MEPPREPQPHDNSPPSLRDCRLHVIVIASRLRNVLNSQRARGLQQAVVCCRFSRTTQVGGPANRFDPNPWTSNASSTPHQLTARTALRVQSSHDAILYARFVFSPAMICTEAASKRLPCFMNPEYPFRLKRCAWRQHQRQTQNQNEIDDSIIVAEYSIDIT